MKSILFFSKIAFYSLCVFLFSLTKITAQQCPSVIVQAVSGSGMADKVGYTPCGTECPMRYFLAYNDGYGTEETVDLYDESIYGWVTDDYHWIGEVVFGNRTEMDPDRTATGNPRIPTSCTHDDVFVIEATTEYRYRKESGVYHVGMPVLDPTGCTYVDGVSTPYDCSAWEDPSAAYLGTWLYYNESDESSCVETVHKEAWADHSLMDDPVYGYETYDQGYIVRTGTWYSKEYKTSDLVKRAQANAMKELPSFPTDNPITSNDPEVSIAVNAAEDCATAISSKWRARITGAQKGKDYIVSYRRTTRISSNGAISSSFTDINEKVTAPGSIWWYPSAAGKIMDPPSWVPGDCATGADGVSTITLSNFNIKEAPTASASGSGSVGQMATAMTSCNGCGAASSTDGGIHFQISMGNDFAGGSAGYFMLNATLPDRTLSRASSLTFTSETDADNGILVERSADGALSYVTTPEGYAEILPGAYKYQIDIYDSAMTLVTSWLIENPDASRTIYNRLKITEQAVGENVRIWMYTYASGTWTLTVPDNLYKEIRTQTIDQITGNRTSVFQRLKPSEELVYERKQVYAKYPWGEVIISDTVGSGADAEVTEYTYYTGSGDAGYTPSANQAPLKTITRPDGTWVAYEYDLNGRIAKQYSGYGTQGVTFDSSLCAMTQYGYAAISSPDDGTYEPRAPRTEIDYLLGTEIGRRYHIISAGERRDIICQTPLALWNASDNLVTITKYNTSGDFEGALQSAENPDGTMIIYDYVKNIDGTKSITVSQGEPNVGKTAIADGSITTYMNGVVGEPLSEETKDILSNITLESKTYSNHDYFHRPLLITYLDGSTEEFSFLCCGIDTYKDRNGTTTEYIYDALKRKTGVSSHDVTTIETLDAAGNVLVTKRIGSDMTEMILSQSAYNTAGVKISETNPLGGVTHYSKTMVSGQMVKTVINPDNGTKIETFYRDGALQKLTGTAIYPIKFEYGIDSNPFSSDYLKKYQKSTKLSSSFTDTSEIVTNYFDMVGRNYRTVFAASNAPIPTSTRVYNANGQLWKEYDPDDIVTIYEYNSKGQLEYTIIDVNNDGKVLASHDRIQQVKRDVTSSGFMGQDVQRTRIYIWDINDNATAKLIRTTEESVDGLKRWEISHVGGNNVISKTEKTISDSYGISTTTHTAGDNLTSASQFEYGRLSSIIFKDNLGTQIGTRTFGYDSYGRQSVITDARNGTTRLTYNNADQIVVSSTPPPGTGDAGQTTQTLYDSALRAYCVIQPDGTILNREYYPTGLLKKEYGTRTYPVEYTYDAQGRMQTMKTWQNFANNLGAATTTWTYGSSRGWLSSKLYHGQSVGTEYTYTAGGRLKTRKWARTGTGGQRILTTYTYGFDDGASGNDFPDLLSIVYSNDPASTPQVTFTYDRRGRKSTTSFNGMTTTEGYNDANLPTTESFSGGTLAGYTSTLGYDSYLRQNALSANTATAISQSFSYDSASRLFTVTDGIYSSAYSYHPNSRLISTLTHKENSTVRLTESRTYDNLNRLLSIWSTSGASGQLTMGFAYQYNTANQRRRATAADGSFWIYRYDTLGQVISGKKYWADGTPVAGQQFEYGFDDIGNRLSTKAGGDENGMNLQSASYTPNLLNQYTQRTVPGAVPVLGLAEAASTVTVNSGSTYRHGEYFWKELSAANTTMPVWQSVSVQAVHGVNNNTVSGNVFVPQTPEAYSYDLDGNLTGDGRWTYSWDAENRLVRLVAATAVGPQQRIDFEYDAQSRRIRKKIWNNTSGTGTPATDIKFLYQGWNLMAELNALSSDAVIRSFVWGNDLSGTFQGAGGVGGLLAVKSGGVCHFTAYDGNGNVIALVDGSTGSPSAQYEYGPFGEMIRSTGSLGNANSFRFSTKYQDEESGLYYYSYRYYNTVFGNWLSRDPIEEKGGRNLYGFVGNNPVSFIDPFGLERIELWIAAFISPIEIRFPYYSNPNAFWHGDDRDFNTGTRPVSSRVWHWIVIETDPAKKPIVNNISGAGLTTVTTYGPLGLETTKTGQAAAPPPAIITRNGCILYVWITADEGNPLIAGAPHIKYSYNFTFDVKKGVMTVTGSHGVYPWHEVNTTKGQAFPPFSPVPGSSPADLFKSPVTIKAKTFTIQKYPCCNAK